MKEKIVKDGAESASKLPRRNFVRTVATVGAVSYTHLTLPTKA